MPHFGRSEAAIPAAVVQQPYRITHSERRLVHALVRCVDCGMVTLPLHYAPVACYREAEDPYYIEQAAQRIANSHRLLELVPRGGRLLEIGCACGFLLLAARQRGFEAEGVEMSEWASRIAREKYGLEVKTGRLEGLGVPDDTFDLVVMADVIEHLTDPRGTVREVRRIMRRGGRLLLLTPDVGSVAARLAGTRWWGLLDDHYFYFSRTTLERFLAGEGFAVDRLAAQGRQFALSHWVFKLEPYSAVLHETLQRATRAVGLDRLQLSVNLGDQLACVARKK